MEELKARTKQKHTTAVVAFRVSRQLMCSISKSITSKMLPKRGELVWGNTGRINMESGRRGFRWRSHPERQR